MSTGTFIGIILTIIVAAISARSGKKKVTRAQKQNVPPPTGNDLPDFWEMMRQRIEEANNTEPQPYARDVTEQYQSLEESPSLETITSQTNQPKRGKYEDKPIEHISIMQEAQTEQITFEFDLRNAVIYSELLKPKHLEY